MAGSFHIHLLSNTLSQNTNKTSAFKVRLPRTLEFNATWRVALVNIIYPYSWPNIGTDDSQFIDVYWQDKTISRVRVKTSG